MDRPNEAQKPHPQKQLLEITFGKDDAQWVQHPHNDLLVVTLAIAYYTIHRLLIDNGSSCNTPSPLRLGLSPFFFYNKIFAKIHKIYQST
jgi:hypothetical protein